MRKTGFILIIGALFSFLISAITTHAVEGYVDSGLPCDQTSGKVLCQKRYNSPTPTRDNVVLSKLNVIFTIPREIADSFNPTADNFFPEDRSLNRFDTAIIYSEGERLLAESCVGGNITVEVMKPPLADKVEIFDHWDCNFSERICQRWPSCQRDSACWVGLDFIWPSKTVPACAPLTQRMSVTASDNAVPEGGSYTVVWQATNPGTQCQLSGKMPDNFSANTTSGRNTFFNVPTGGYAHKFTCMGVVDGSKSAQTGSITKTVTVKVGDIPPPPAGQLTGNVTEIKKGEAVTLNWNVSNAESITIDQGIGRVSNTGSITVFPKFTTRYSLEALGKYPELGGKLRSSVTIRVQTPTLPAPPLSKPPEVITPAEPEPPIFQAAPTPVAEPKLDLKVNGQDGPITLNAPASFEISWNLDRYCIAYGPGWLGVKSKAETQTVNNSTVGTHTYKMYCPGFSSASDSVTINIVGSSEEIISSSPITPRIIPLPIAEAGVSLDGVMYGRSIRVVRGKPVSLWVSASRDLNGDNKASRDASGGWSEIQDGGQCQFNIDLNSGTPTFEGVVNEPVESEMCNVPFGEKIFNDPPGVYRYGVLRLVQGDGKISSIAYINVAVVNPPPPKGPPVIDISANGKAEKVTLGVPSEYAISWTTQDADTCVALGAWSGNQPTNGNQTFVGSAKKELTYGLTCKGPLGTTTRSVIVKLAEVPICAFTALPSVLDTRSVFVRESELAWSCRFADTCRIVPALGASIKTFGSVRVSPIISTTYNLICGNAEGEQSFDATVKVQ